MGVGRIPEGKQPLKEIQLLALRIHPYGLRSLDMCFGDFGDSSLGFRTRNLGIYLRGYRPLFRRTNRSVSGGVYSHQCSSCVHHG